MSGSSVIDKVKKRIGELEHAIQRLDFVKRHLNQNSSEIKSQIHTSISRHLETLRNREVWLLEQVDTVLGAKEEVLHRQQARLNKALGILHSSVAHSRTTDDETAAKHLAQALEELTATELKAEETPYIAFRADHVAMRESILSYGRVDANGLPLQSAFADFSKPSASLPRHLEEYEDSEHHVFYKNLQEGKIGPVSIQVCMPKLSTRVEDWLQRPMLHLSTSILEPHVVDSGKVAVTPVTQKCSIQSWLSQIKHNPDVEEEDDFEIVDHSSSSQRESPIEEEASEKPKLLDLFHHISQDACQWLIKGSSTSPKEEDLRAFFKHIPKDTSMWLLTAQRQLESLEQLKSGQWFPHIPTETSTWLRRAHDKQAAASQAAYQNFFAHITSDKSFWLWKKAAEAKPADVKQSEPLRDPMMIFTAVPPAESVTSSTPLSTATCTPVPIASSLDVMKEYVRKMPYDEDSWLMKYMDAGTASDADMNVETKTPCIEKEERSSGLERYHATNFNTSAWLVRCVDDVSSKLPVISFFSHISNNQCDWLLGAGTRDATNPARPISLQKMAWGDSNQWLKPSRSFIQEVMSPDPFVSPLESWQHAHRHMTTADWLVDSRLENEILVPEKSWSVVSTSSASSGSSFGSSVSSGLSASSSGSSFLLGAGKPALPIDLASWILQKRL